MCYTSLLVRPATKKGGRWSLYWCTTPDGDEDWFVVATSAASAARFFENDEGYARGEAHARRVVALPPALLVGPAWRNGPEGEIIERADWPSDALLIACGGEIASSTPGPKGEALRAYMGVNAKDVRFGDEVFRSGDVVQNLAQDAGMKEARLSVFKGAKS